MSEKPNILTVMDAETLKVLAEASGRAAAKEIGQEIRESIRDEMDARFSQMIKRHEEQMDERLKTFFGEKGGQSHIVQHDRIERFLTMLDKVSDNFVTAFIKNIVMGLIVILVLGYFAWHSKFGGGV